MESKANSLMYPLSDTEQKELEKKDDMINVMSRANLFANDKDLNELPSFESTVLRAVEELTAEC
jgi:hypothetical protein